MPRHYYEHQQSTAQNDSQAEALPVVSGVFSLGFKPGLSSELCNRHKHKDHRDGGDQGDDRVHCCAHCVVHPSAFEQKHPILSAFLDVATHPITMFTFGVFVGLVGPVLSFVWGF